MSLPPQEGDHGMPPDFEAPPPDDLEVQRCYRHPDRETGVSCASCGRPICHDCMIQAPVGFHCPECVRQAHAGNSRARVVGRGQIRSRWDGGLLRGGAPVTRILIGINVVVFVAGMLLGGSSLVSVGALVPGYVWDGQYWRLLTAMFLHAGFFHILFNMWALYIGGSFLEMVAGRTKYLIIYFVAGISGNVAVLLLSPLWQPTVGASTAIFGVFGALFVYSLHYRDTALGQALRGMGLIIAINLIITFLPGFQISWQGHIGGLIGGVAALEAVSWFGRRDLRAPFATRDVALLGAYLGLLVALVLVGASAAGA